jgi:acyl dehydratase
MVDQSVVGRTFTPVTARVEPGRLRFFLDTIGETNPLYRDKSAARAAGYADAAVPPTYLFCLEMMDAAEPFEFLNALGIDIARVLHGEQRFDYHAPIAIGDTLTFRPRVTSVTEKKGGAMTLIAIATEVINQDGVHVADTSRTVVVRNARPS